MLNVASLKLLIMGVFLSGCGYPAYAPVKHSFINSFAMYTVYTYASRATAYKLLVFLYSEVASFWQCQWR